MNLKYNIKHFLILTTAMLLSISNVFAEEFESELAWSKRIGLSTPVSGLVQKVHAVQGKIAAKGDVLIQLDPRIFKANLKHAEAQLKHSQETNIEAKRELERQLDMYDRSMLSEHDLQVAKNNFTAAQSQFQQAESSLTKAKVQLEYSAVRAPFNAVIVKITAVKGQVVATAMSPPVLVVVAEANRMLTHFFIAEAKLSELTVNQGVKVSVAGKKYQGKILSIALEPAGQKGYKVVVIFDSKNILLRAGQKSKVSL